MDPKYDLTGKTFGRLKVIGLADKRGTQGEYYWRCKCSCPDHNEIVMSTRGLHENLVPSCGCHRKEILSQLRRRDITGQTFGRLTAIRPVSQGSQGEVIWECRCSCPDKNIVNVRASNLVSGGVRSCGCLAKEISSLVHSKWKNDAERRLSKILDGMKQRCHNPNSSAYHNYGAKGIYVCDEWRNDTKAFVKWSLNHGYVMGKGLEIDRWPYKNGPYAPWNCRWATHIENNNNKTLNIDIVVNGIKKTLKEWSRELNINYKQLWRRYHNHGEKSAIDFILQFLPEKDTVCNFTNLNNNKKGDSDMTVLSLVDLPSPLPLGVFTGNFGTQAVLDELNSTWKNSGSGVVFGADTFGDKFKAFSNMICAQAEEIKSTVLKTIEATCCPNKIQEIVSLEDLRNIPVCMYIPILTMPEARTLYEAGMIDGWGIKPWDLPQEDVVGRLLNNGTFDTGSDNYDREAPIKWTYQTGDPNYDLEELSKIRTTRAFISTFIEEQLGEDGDNLDFSDYPNRMGKIKELD